MTEDATQASARAPLPVAIGLTAAIVAVRGDEPLILTARRDNAREITALPSGPFDPVEHRTFEIGLRAWVAEQTGAPLGYVEQLYTFGDRGRHARAGDRDPHIVSVGYLALTRIGEEASDKTAGFRDWHEFFPWEDWRGGRPDMIEYRHPAGSARLGRGGARRRFLGRPVAARALQSAVRAARPGVRRGECARAL